MTRNFLAKGFLEEKKMGARRQVHILGSSMTVTASHDGTRPLPGCPQFICFENVAQQAQYHSH